MKPLPGHYLGSVANYASDTPWDLEYSLALEYAQRWQGVSPAGGAREDRTGRIGSHE